MSARPGRTATRRLRQATLAVLAWAVVGCDAPTVAGRADIYPFTLPGGEVVRWPTGKIVRVVPVGGTDPDRRRLLRAAFRNGAAGWNRAVLYNEYRFEAVGRAEDADVVLAWSDVPLPVDTAGCPPEAGGIAVTTFCASERRPGRLRPFPLRGAEGPARSPVRMLVLIRPAVAGDPVRARQAVAHELGHVLGIARHSPDPTDLLWGGELQTAVPSPADRATVQVLYHTRPDIVP